jgi:hypothetical protein
MISRLAITVLLLTSCPLIVVRSTVRAAEPYAWGIGHGEITRDAALTSIQWEFVTEPNQIADWTISNVPPLDPTNAPLGHDLAFNAQRGVDPSIDFDAFASALAGPLFRVDLALDGQLAASNYESESTAWSNIQIDKIETTIHYNRSTAGVWSFWPSLFLYGTATPIPEPSFAAMLAFAVFSTLGARRHKSIPHNRV